MGTLNPLQLFPLEIWKIIFETFEGEPGCSKNMLNCSNVCTTFQNTLRPKESQWIFELIFPHVFPYLKGKHILRCRQVCKEWCRVVDNFIEDFESRHPFNDETSNVSRLMSKWHSEYRDPLKTKIKWTRLSDSQEVSKFMSVMKPQGRNPFVGNTLILEDCDPEEEDSDPEEEEQPDLDLENERFYVNRFWKKASELLLMFGDHIKFFEWNLDEQHMNAYDFCDVLLLILPSLPNLRSLTVSGELDELYHPDRRMLTLRLWNSSRVKLHSLESLVLQVRHLPRIFCEKLISLINPRKLKTLIFDVLLHLYDNYMIEIIEPLSSLTELHLTNIKCLEYLDHWLSNIQDAPLGKLVLQFCPRAEKQMNFDLVCGAINRFGKTLKMLAITENFVNLNSIDRLRIHSLSNLETPHLRSLEMHGLIFRSRFLPKSCEQSLEYLHISFPWEGANRPDLKLRRMKFYKRAARGDLCYLRAWEKMPNLKILNVYLGRKKFSCSKRMYLEVCEGLERKASNSLFV